MNDCAAQEASKKLRQLQKDGAFFFREPLKSSVFGGNFEKAMF